MMGFKRLLFVLINLYTVCQKAAAHEQSTSSTGSGWIPREMIVEVEEGELQGVEMKSSFTGRPFWAFLGIPFAKPPVDDLRFKAPEPTEKWNGVRDAMKEGDDCIQEIGQMKIIGSEDCLYLNVYTPEAPSETEKKKAVMIYLHGGAFRRSSSSADRYGPDFLINHDVVYVIMNYRLHVFGFLNTGTPSSPGNAGLKDQLLAMKWVKRNIARFGGDPDNITLMGISAGATCTHLHMLSPLSKGLFHKAIAQSGTALSPWAIERDPESRAREIGALAGYQGQDMEGLVQHLKNQPGRKLVELACQCVADAQKNNPARCTLLVFIPSVEKIKDNAFLPDSLEKLMQFATPIPTIFGLTNQEGLMIFESLQLNVQILHTTLEVPQNSSEHITPIKEQFLSYQNNNIMRQSVGEIQPPEFVDLVFDDLSIVVKENFHLNESQQRNLLEKIEEFYFRNKSFTRSSFAPLVDLYTDLVFLKFFKSIDHLIRSNIPPYIYLFDYDGSINFNKNIIASIADVKNINGACHADDIGYLFSQKKWPARLNETDRNFIYHFCTLWTNFAKTGNPTSTRPNIYWKLNTLGHPSYLRIGETMKPFNSQLFEERFNFWKPWLEFASY